MLRIVIAGLLGILMLVGGVSAPAASAAVTKGKTGTSVVQPVAKKTVKKKKKHHKKKKKHKKTVSAPAKL